MTQINVKIDDDVKTASEALFKRLGLSMSAAITLFLHQAINHHGLPFEIKEAGYSSTVDDELQDVFGKLRQASRNARVDTVRLSHQQVFDGLQEIIDVR